MCTEVVDESLLVEEAAIADAMRSLVGGEHVLVEGAAANALAAVSAHRERFRGQDVVVLLCGANVDPSVLQRVLAGAL